MRKQQLDSLLRALKKTREVGNAEKLLNHVLAEIDRSPGLSSREWEELQANALVELARLTWARSDPDRGRAASAHAVEAWRRIANVRPGSAIDDYIEANLGLLTALLEIASIEFRANDAVNAQAHLTKALELYERASGIPAIGNHPDSDLFFTCLGRVGVEAYLATATEMLATGDHAACAELIAAVIAIAGKVSEVALGRANQRLAEQAEAWASACATLSLRGTVSAQSAELSGIVEGYYDLALDAARIAGDHNVAAAALEFQGKDLALRNEFTAAREKLTEALTAQHAANSKPGSVDFVLTIAEVGLCLLLARVCADLSDHHAAADYCDTALSQLQDIFRLFPRLSTAALRELISPFLGEVDRLTKAAQSATEAGDAELAEAQFRQARRIAHEIGDPGRECFAVASLAELLHARDRHAEAYQLARDGLRLGAVSGRPVDIALVLWLFNKLDGRPGRTRTLFTIRRQSAMAQEEIVPFLEYAWYALELDKPRIANSYFWSAYEAAMKLHDERGLGEALCGLGAVAVLEGKPTEARSYLNRALRVYRIIADRSGAAPLLTMLDRSAEAAVLCWLSEVHRHEGGSDRALRLAEQARLTAGGAGEEVMYVPRLPKGDLVPVIYDFTGEAIAIWEARAADRGSDATVPWSDFQLVHGLLAVLPRSLREPDKVYEWAQEACQLASAIGDVAGELEAICWTSSSECGIALALERENGEMYRAHVERVAYRFLGLGGGYANSDVFKTRFYLNQALAAFQGLRDPVGEASALRALGNLSDTMGHANDARALFEQALHISDAANDLAGQAHARRRLARMLDGDAAIEMARQARRLARKAGDRLGAAYALRLIGMIDQRATGFRALEKALRELQSLDHPVPSAEAYTLRCLGWRALERGHFRRADGYFSRAVAAAEHLDKLGRVAAMEGRVRALIAPVRKRREVIQEAASLAFEAVQSLEQFRQSIIVGTDRFAFYRQRRDLYLLALRLAAMTDDGQAALRIIEAARSDGLASLLRYGWVNVPGKFGKLLQAISELEESWRAAGPLPDQELPGALRDSAGDAGAELNALYQELAENSPILRAAIDPISDFTRDFNTDPPGQHILLYDIDSGERLCFTVWVEPAGNSHVQVRRLSPELIAVLGAWARRERRTRAGSFEEFEALSAVLLPEELRKQLKANASGVPPRLLVVPAGVFWALPIAGLPIDGRRRLVECTEISYAPSLGVYEALTGDGTGSGAWAYFHTDLAGAEPERAALAELFPTSFRELSEAELRDTLRSGGAAALRILVIAAHGDDRPGLAHSLRLDDGKLTAGELLMCRLPELVVLGVCSSAKLEVDPGSEPLGLPTACLAAGTQSLIAALFPVDDQSTGQILAATYNRVAGGMSPAAALRLAQLDHLRSCDRPGGCRPSHWAGLVTFGSQTRA